MLKFCDNINGNNKIATKPIVKSNNESATNKSTLPKTSPVNSLLGTASRKRNVDLQNTMRIKPNHVTKQSIKKQKKEQYHTTLKLIDALAEKNQIDPEIKTKSFYLYHSGNPNKSLTFHVIHCIPNGNRQLDNYNDYELQDVNWIVSYGQKNLTITSLQLLMALTGDKVVLEIFNEQEDLRYNQMTLMKKQLENIEKKTRSKTT